MQPGDSVAVIGCGGVGLNVVQGARLAGATTIVAVDVKDSALAFARKFGATHIVNARTEDAVARVQALTGGGAHFAFEAYGGGATTRMAVDMLRKRGTAVIVGIAPIGDTAAIEPVVLTRGEKTITRHVLRLGPSPPGHAAHRRLGASAAGSTSTASSPAATRSPTSTAPTRTSRPTPSAAA